MDLAIALGPPRRCNYSTPATSCLVAQARGSLIRLDLTVLAAPALCEGGAGSEAHGFAAPAVWIREITVQTLALSGRRVGGASVIRGLTAPLRPGPPPPTVWVWSQHSKDLPAEAIPEGRGSARREYKRVIDGCVISHLLALPLRALGCTRPRYRLALVPQAACARSGKRNCAQSSLSPVGSLSL